MTVSFDLKVVIQGLVGLLSFLEDLSLLLLEAVQLVLPHGLGNGSLSNDDCID